VIEKRLSPIKEESPLSISPKVKKHSSMEILWEKLLVNVPLCAMSIEQFSTSSYETNLTEYINCISAKSIINRKSLELSIKYIFFSPNILRSMGNDSCRTCNYDSNSD